MAAPKGRSLADLMKKEGLRGYDTDEEAEAASKALAEDLAAGRVGGTKARKKPAKVSAAADVRAEVDKHPFATAELEMFHSKDGLVITNVEFEWFDNQDAAEEFAGSLHDWGCAIIKEVPDSPLRGVITFKTGTPLKVLATTVQGFESEEVADRIRTALFRGAEQVMFADQLDLAVFPDKEDNEKGKVPATNREATAKVKKVAASKTTAPIKPKVGAARKANVPAKKPETATSTIKPVVRSRSFRGPAKKAAS